MKQLIPHATLAEIEGAGHLPPLEPQKQALIICAHG